MNVGLPSLPVRYTTDGTRPTSVSSRYAEPVRVDDAATVRLRMLDTLGRGGRTITLWPDYPMRTASASVPVVVRTGFLAAVLLCRAVSEVSAQALPKHEFRGAGVATTFELDWQPSASVTPGRYAVYRVR